MITALLAGIAASPGVRAALRYGALALAVLMFLFSLRRSGERAGRLVERLEATEKVDEIQRRMLEAAARGSDPVRASVCPPVVEYSREFQMQAADELALLPDGSAIVGMTSDYQVMRAQARACQG